MQVLSKCEQNEEKKKKKKKKRKKKKVSSVNWMEYSFDEVYAWKFKVVSIVTP